MVRVPAVYAELGEALLPARWGEPPDSSPDPRHRPPPARLEVTEHRHLLLKGLRWWVDAVQDVTVVGKGRTVGESVPRMCATLLHYLPNMAAEDQETLQANLWEWVGGAMPLVGKVPAPVAPLPVEALDRVVPVHVAAEALGVSVSTVQRRSPGRVGGRVKLSEVAGPLCELSDLPAAWCGQCPSGAHRLRSVTL